MSNSSAAWPSDPEPFNPRAPIDPRSILTSIGEAVYDWDLTRDTIAWGSNAAEVFGLADLAPLSNGRAFALATEIDSGPTRHDAILNSPAKDEGGGVPYRTRYTLRLTPERAITVEDTGRWFADSQGLPAFAHGVVRIDKAAIHEGDALRPHDRTHFIAQIAADVAETARSKHSFTLLIAAVEELGLHNESLGYEGTDRLVEEVLRRIGSVMRRRDKLVRYAGNRFAIALLSCPSHQAETAAARIAHVVAAQPIDTASGPVMARLCIGAATVPEHAVDAPTLLRRAEEALSISKRGYGPPIVLYDRSLSREATRRSSGTPAFDVVDALNARRIVFARQPVVDAHTRNTVFQEALVRMKSEDGSIVTASDLLPAIEHAGIVPLLDHRMLELTSDYLVAHPDEKLSVNVSPLTLEEGDWLPTLAAHLGARPGIASRMIIEIVETAAVKNPVATRARLDAMKALGVAIAIDDFGAGHTSFKHLRSFPVDLLKIDGAFVQNLARSTDDRFFVRTLIDLAHHLGIATVAEWVEDEATALMLAEWGVDYLQGNHCAWPILEETLPEETKVA